MFFNNKNVQSSKLKYLARFIMFALALVLLPHCAKEEKPTEELTFDELKTKTLSALEEKNYKASIAPLEMIISAHAERQDIAKYKLLLADSYFNTGNLESAYQMYEYFAQFYPSDKHSEYARYQAIRSKFYQTLKIDCDQTLTEETINMCKGYLANKGYDQVKKKDIEDIKKTCERKLLDKEIYVYNFYLKRKEYRSAQNRLKNLREKFLQNSPDVESRILYLECKLANKQKNKDSVDKIQNRLLKEYPESEFTRMAFRLTNKETFVF